MKMIKYKIFIIEGAKLDIKDSRTHYRSIYKSLGKRFTADLKRVVKTISTSPLTFGFRFNDFRTANLNIFPYQLHFMVEEETHSNIIFAVLHAHRDPDFIKSRLRG